MFGAISLDLVAVLLGGAVALLPAIAENRLGVGAVGLGWLQSRCRYRSNAGSCDLIDQTFERHIGRSLMTAVAIFGLGTIVLGLTGTLLSHF